MELKCTEFDLSIVREVSGTRGDEEIESGTVDVEGPTSLTLRTSRGTK